MINDAGKGTVADANFGSGTENGTNLFKKSVGLPEDGKVDDLTYGRMLNKFQNVTVVDNSAELTAKAKEIADLKADLLNESEENIILRDAVSYKSQENMRLQATIGNKSDIIAQNNKDSYDLGLLLLARNDKINSLGSELFTANSVIDKMLIECNKVVSIKDATIGELISAAFKKIKPAIDKFLNTK